MRCPVGHGAVLGLVAALLTLAPLGADESQPRRLGSAAAAAAAGVRRRPLSAAAAASALRSLNQTTVTGNQPGPVLSLSELRAAFPRLHRDVYELKVAFRLFRDDAQRRLESLGAAHENLTTSSTASRDLEAQVREFKRSARKQATDWELRLSALEAVLDGVQRRMSAEGVQAVARLANATAELRSAGVAARTEEAGALRRALDALERQGRARDVRLQTLERAVNESLTARGGGRRKAGGGGRRGTAKGTLRGEPRRHVGVCNVKAALRFPAASVSSAASFRKGLSAPLSAFTACFWLRTSAGYVGTVLSYATEDNDNKLVLYGRAAGEGRLQLVIGDPEYRELPAAALLDGGWHHACVMWSSAEGRYAYYVDRRLAAAGSGFRRGYAVASGGSLMLGQEQDAMGGGFERHEAFVGSLAGFALWTRSLAPGEVSALARGGQLPMEGVALTFSDLGKLSGDAKLVQCDCLDDC
ncbi:unnamed protein product [Lampetra planeri]